MEDFIKLMVEIETYIERYNFNKVHMGLERSHNENRLRSCDILFKQNYKWQKDYEWIWYKYGMEVPFPVDLKE